MPCLDQLGDEVCFMGTVVPCENSWRRNFPFYPAETTITLGQ